MCDAVALNEYEIMLFDSGEVKFWFNNTFYSGVSYKQIISYGYVDSNNNYTIYYGKGASNKE